MHIFVVSVYKWYTNSKSKTRYVVDTFKNSRGIKQVTYVRERLNSPIHTCSEKSFLLWVNKK